MQLKQLEYFVEVADQRSIHKAADILYASQPNLTRSIKHLEEEMGGCLFVRSNQGVELTQLGENIYYYAKSILNQVETLKQIQSEDPETVQSSLTVSIAHLAMADNLIFDLYNQVKTTRTVINIDEASTKQTIDDIVSLKSEIGLAIVNSAQLSVFRRRLQVHELNMLEIGTGSIYVHFSAKSSLYGKESICIKDLMNCYYVHFPYDMFGNINYAIKVQGMQLGALKKTITMNSYHHIIAMLRNIDGFMFGNMWQAEELKKAGIYSKKIEQINQKNHFILISRQKENLSKTGRLFINVIKEYYGNMQEL